MMQLIENDWRDTPERIRKAQASSNASSEFAKDQLGYSSGDSGEEYIPKDITPKRTRVIRSAEDMENRRHSKWKHGAKGYRPSDIEDIGRHLDPQTGKGHWIGNPDSGFDPGEAIPRDKSRIEKAIKDEYGVSTDEFLRIIDIIKPKSPEQADFIAKIRSVIDTKLPDDMKDITDREGIGKQDVSADPNPTSPSLRVGRQEAGYNMGATEMWKGKLDKAIKDIIQIKSALPDQVGPEVQKLLSMIDDMEQTPGIHPKLIEKANDQKELAKKILAKQKIQSQPAQDTPERSPMTKYMLRKNSNVF